MRQEQNHSDKFWVIGKTYIVLNVVNEVVNVGVCVVDTVFIDSSVHSLFYKVRLRERGRERERERGRGERGRERD